MQFIPTCKMKPTTRLFWLCAVPTLLNAFTSAGFSIIALSSSGDAHLNAMYGASRSITLALVALLVVLLRNKPGLLVVALIMVGVQAGDAVIGAINHDPMKTYGPAFLAIITLAGLVALFRATRSQRMM